MNPARLWWAGYAAVYDRLWRGPVTEGLGDAVAARIEAAGEPLAAGGA